MAKSTARYRNTLGPESRDQCTPVAGLEISFPNHAASRA